LTYNLDHYKYVGYVLCNAFYLQESTSLKRKRIQKGEGDVQIPWYSVEA